MSKPQLGHLVRLLRMGAGRVHTFSRLHYTVTISQACDGPSKRPLQLAFRADGASLTHRKGKCTSHIVQRVSDTVPGVLLSSTYRGEVGQRTMKARNPRPIRARNMPATFPILSLGPPPFPLQLGLGTRRRTGAPVAFSLIRCAPPIPGRPLIGTVITLLSRWSRPRDTMIERRRVVPGTPETHNCNPSPAARLDQYRG